MVRSGDEDKALLPAKMDNTQHPVSQNSGNTFLKIKLPSFNFNFHAK